MPDFVNHPRGAPFPARLLTLEERDNLAGGRLGKVSLVARAQQPVEVGPLRRATLAETPAVARTWLVLAGRHLRTAECHRQVVRPVSARSRLSSRAMEVVYVRVWVREPDRLNRCILRSWRRPYGGDGKWTADSTSIFRPWRTHIAGRKISVKEAKEIIVTGEM
jgi:hypothetical protein